MKLKHLSEEDKDQIYTDEEFNMDHLPWSVLASDFVGFFTDVFKEMDYETEDTN